MWLSTARTRVPNFFLAEVASLQPPGCRHDFCCVHILSALQEAKDVGDEFLALEKFVNLNYMVRPSPELVIM